MGLSRRSFSLLLALTPGIGGRSLTRILARNDLLGRAPEQFLSLSPTVWREEYKLSAKAIAGLSTAPETQIERLQTSEKHLEGLGVSLVTAVDAHYPALIEEMDPDPPGILFMYGNMRLLEARTFCVMSSRDSRPADLELVEKLTEEGVLNGEVLVTSHNKPEYQRSAIVPLRWGSPRILCLDQGLFNVLGPDLRDEAFRAARLWRYEFDATTDLAISPFRPDADFIGVNNKVRDRLVACLSRRLDFAQIAEGGNMEKLALLALKSGRPVRVSDRNLNYRQLRAQGAEVIAV